MISFKEYLNESSKKQVSVTDAEGNKLGVEVAGDNVTFTLNGTKYTFSYKKYGIKLNSAISRSKETVIPTSKGDLSFEEDKDYNKHGAILSVDNGDFFHFTSKTGDKILDVLSAW